MLNRRLLRIKVMQSLYSYHQAVGADLMLAQDRIAAAFEPDLTAKEAPDRRLLEGQRKLGEAQLRDWYRTGTMPEKTDDKAVDAALTDAIGYFEAQVKKDGDFYGGQLLVGAESIHDQYLHLLNLPAALLGVLEEEQSREERRRLGPSENALDTGRLHRNAAIAKLMASARAASTALSSVFSGVVPVRYQSRSWASPNLRWPSSRRRSGASLAVRSGSKAAAMRSCASIKSAPTAWW